MTVRSTAPTPAALERLARACDITAYRSSGPGGQKKNKTESSVRVRHRATGIVRIATESRSQRRNRMLALERVWRELERRARVPAVRRPTRPTGAAIEGRLAEKRRRAIRKRERGMPAEE